jgi:branched-chain amino acid transport system permease protein
MATRSHRARASMRGYRTRFASATGLDRVAAEWRQLPPPVRQYLPVVLVVSLAITYPFYVDSLPTNIPLILSFPSLHDTVTILVFVMMAVGLNVVVGYAGLLDLGYVAFYAIGAYTAGWLASGQFQQVNIHFGTVGVGSNERGVHISVWLVLLIAAVVTAIGGILIGLPTLRLRGDYLAIVTLGFGEIIPQFVRNGDNLHGFDLTHGTFGISPIDAPGFGGTLHNALGLPIRYDDSFPPTPDRLFFWTLLGLLLLTVFCSLRLRESRLGRAWIAIREDETAAGAMGIPLMRTKTWAYAIGAFFGGIAGAYIAAFNSGAFPTQFDFNISVFLLCMVILGGMGSLWGVIVAGTILAWLNFDGLGNIGSWLNTHVFPHLHGAWHGLPGEIDVPKYSFGIYGLIIVLMMLFRPTGLIPESRRKREIDEAQKGGPLDEPLDETPGADEPGGGERGAPGSIPRG